MWREDETANATLADRPEVLLLFRQTSRPGPEDQIMKERRLHNGLRSVATALNVSISKSADPFCLLQSIAAACGVALGDDGLMMPDDCQGNKSVLQVRLRQQAVSF